MIGNDDCGQMSAWYILSTLGFYPVNPTNGEFILGSPQIKKATLHLTNKKDFSIDVKKNSNENIYYETRFLNNTKLEIPFVSFKEINNGGTLKFEMTKQE